MNSPVTILFVSWPAHQIKLLNFIVVQITQYVEFESLVWLTFWSRDQAFTIWWTSLMLILSRSWRHQLKLDIFGDAGDCLKETRNWFANILLAWLVIFAITGYSGSSLLHLCTELVTLQSYISLITKKRKNTIRNS